MFFDSGRGVQFDLAIDITSQAGKVFLVTGGNIGLGKQSILELAKHSPSRIWLTARSAEKAKAAIADVQRVVPHAQIEFLQLDLSSLESVKQAAKTFLASSPRLDVLLLNAGIMAAPPDTTKEGYEIQFGTNHVGHALLTKLLLPRLLETASLNSISDVRVVVVSSVGHRWTPSDGIKFGHLKSRMEDISTWYRYGQSKLANILYAKELAKRYPQLKVVSVHPGRVRSNLIHSYADGNPVIRLVTDVSMRLTGVPVEEGVKNQLWASTNAGIISGEYYEPIALRGKGNKNTKDDLLAARLWDWTENELERYGI